MVKEQTNLSYINEAIDHLHTKLTEKISTKKIELPKIKKNLSVLYLYHLEIRIFGRAFIM